MFKISTNGHLLVIRQLYNLHKTSQSHFAYFLEQNYMQKLYSLSEKSIFQNCVKHS